MAKNGAIGNGRVGMVDRRSQFYNPIIDMWIKRDITSGRIMDVKTSGGKFKGVRREN